MAAKTHFPVASRCSIEPLETRIAPAFTGTLNLGNLGSQGFTLHSPAPGADSFGRTVSDAGDVNGDGFDDFLVGANSAAEGGSKRGAAYLIFGTADGAALANLDLAALDGTQGFKMSGVFNGDYAGSYVSAAGDVNGDGFGDVLISTQESGAGSLRGAVYVVYGRASFADTHGSLSLAGLDGTNGFKIPGLANSDFLHSGDGVGDVNGDGFDDLFLSADGGGGTFRGVAYVIFGGKNIGLTNGSFDLATLNGANGFAAPGLANNDELGINQSLGDINGDGFDDLSVTSNDIAAGGTRGATYVILGAPTFAGTGGSFSLATLNGANGFKVPGVLGDNLDGAVGAGDVNGDGFDDFMVKAYSAAAGAGRMYVVFGKANFAGTAGLFDLTTLNGTNGFQFTGLAANNHLGRGGFGAAGDMNGDGIDDLFASAEFAAGGGVSRGESYIIFGKSDFSANAGVVSLAGLDGSNGFRVQGAADGKKVPNSSHGVGDVNGDGYADLLIGGLQTLSASVIYGGPSGAFIAPTITGGKMATFTDVDGDLVTVKVSKGTLTTANFKLLAHDGISPKAQLLSLTLDGAFDGADVSITAKRAVGGDGKVNVGFLDATGVDLGKVTISGDLGRIVAGDTVNDLALKSLTVGSLFTFGGRTKDTGVALSSLVLGGMGPLKVAGDVGGRGFFVQRAGGATSGGDLASLTVGGSLIGGKINGTGEILVQDRLGPVKIAGDLRGGAGKFSGYLQVGTTLASVTIGGSLIGAGGLQSGAINGGSTTGNVSIGGSQIGGSGVGSALISSDGNMGKVSIKGDQIGGTAASSALIFTSNPGANIAGVTIGGDVRSGTVEFAGGILATGTLGPVTIGGDVVGTPDVPYLIRGAGTLAGTKSVAIASLKVGGDFDHALVLGGYGAFNAPVNGHAQIGAISVGGDWVASSVTAGLLTKAGATTAKGVFGNGDDTFITGGPSGVVASIKSVTIKGAAIGTAEDGDRFAIVAEQIGSVSIGGAKLALHAAAKGADPANDLAAIHVGLTPDFVVREVLRTTPAPADTFTATPAAGARGAFPAVINLSSLNGGNGFKISGVADFDVAGFSVSAAGDVNGDGIDDVIIGARGADEGGNSPGASYVVFGQAGGFGASLALSSLDGSNGFKISGEANNDYSGFAVSSAGDMNGDGFADLLIGAAQAAAGGSNPGAAYVVFGRASGFGASVALSTLDGTNGFKLSGVANLDKAGGSVSAAGDVNGDGFADLLIGAYQANEGGTDRGASYVVFGKAVGFGASVALASLDGTNGFKLFGGTDFDFSGTSVSAAGDVNGDGFADLFIGVYRDDEGGSNRGAGYVVFGKAGGFGASVALSALNGPSGVTGFKLTGVATGDFAGISVSAAGDVNGDGFVDLIIGANRADEGGGNRGAAYVVFGQAGGFGTSVALSSLDGTNGFKLSGVANYDYAGISVSAAGDVNGDGFADLIVGAPQADEGGSNRGASYVVFGKAGGFGASLALSALDGSNGFKVSGVTDEDRSGRSVNAAGDVNGDGFADVIVGAYGADEGGNNRGAAYVIYGGPSGEFIDPAFSTDHKTATWTDVDGDLVTLKVSKGTLDASNFELLAKSTTDHHARLLALDLGVVLGTQNPEFDGANVTLTAKRAGGGDGKVHLGFLDASNVDLGAVKIGGDLARMFAGDSADDPALKSLTIDSMGVLGTHFQDRFGEVRFYFAGPVGPVKIAGDVNEGIIENAPAATPGTGKMASLTIGGSLIGGQRTNSGIVVADAIGSLKIGGDLVGGSGDNSGYVEALDIKSLTIGGSMLGGAGQFSGAVFGGASVLTGGFDTSGHAGTITIGGDQRGGSGNLSGSIWVGNGIDKVNLKHDQIGAGTASALIFTSNPGANIGSVTIGGSVRGGTVLFSGGILAGGTLGPVSIKGSVSGTAEWAYTIRGSGPLTGTKSVAITSVKVGGDFDHAFVLAGFGQDDTPTNGHAQIGAITVGGDWSASSVSAGLYPTPYTFTIASVFGNGDDTFIPYPAALNGVIASIASITIKGAARGSFATGDFYGIVAEQIGAVTIGGVKLALTANRDILPIGPTPDFVVREVARV